MFYWTLMTNKEEIKNRGSYLETLFTEDQLRALSHGVLQACGGVMFTLSFNLSPLTTKI